MKITIKFYIKPNKETTWNKIKWFFRDPLRGTGKDFKTLITNKNLNLKDEQNYYAIIKQSNY